jgi:MFS family permease
MAVEPLPGTRRIAHAYRVTRNKQLWPWMIAGIGFVALVAAAGFRATPGALVDPLREEFGWSTGTIGFAISVNLALYGVTAPFAAALMERFGVRKVTAGAMALIALGSGLTVFMTAAWQLVILWGVLVGLGAGSISLGFVATISTRWFHQRQGLVTGVLSAGGATGSLLFLPLVASLAQSAGGWRTGALVVSLAAFATVPLVLLLFREHPADLGIPPYGADEIVTPPPVSGTATRLALDGLKNAARTRPFWLLAAGFAICGASTNGLVATHFIPAAHDHGMPNVTAAGLLAMIGVFDLIGTILSGWLTDRVDSRILLAIYYGLRGASLLVLPQLFNESITGLMIVFVIVYGMDFIATVPPTVALCREHFGMSAPIVFGWVFASHQVGAAFSATLAGVTRDSYGDYAPAWVIAGFLSIGAAFLSMRIRLDNARALQRRARRAALLALRGDAQGALPEFDALADAYTRATGPASEHALDCLRQAAECRAELGYTTAALEQFQQVLTHVQTAHGDTTPTALDLRRTIGKLLFAEGRTTDAGAMLRPLHDDLTLIYGPDYRDTREVADILARLRVVGPVPGDADTAHESGTSSQGH